MQVLPDVKQYFIIMMQTLTQLMSTITLNFTCTSYMYKKAKKRNKYTLNRMYFLIYYENFHLISRLFVSDGLPQGSQRQQPQRR